MGFRQERSPNVRITPPDPGRLGRPGSDPAIVTLLGHVSTDAFLGVPAGIAARRDPRGRAALGRCVRHGCDSVGNVWSGPIMRAVSIEDQEPYRPLPHGKLAAILTFLRSPWVSRWNIIGSSRGRDRGTGRRPRIHYSVHKASPESAVIAKGSGTLTNEFGRRK